MTKQPRPIMADTHCDVVHCPRVADKHWMFDQRLAAVFNRTLSYLSGIKQNDHDLP